MNRVRQKAGTMVTHRVVGDDKPQAKTDEDVPSGFSEDGSGSDGEDDDEPRRRPSDPLGGPAGP